MKLALIVPSTVGCIALLALAAFGVPATQPTTSPLTLLPRMYGINLCAAEFGQSTLPGKLGKHYTYPTTQELDYYHRKGLDLIRFPFRWERVQRAINGPLDPEELNRMDAFVAACRQRGMKVILDPHNYARYYGKLIGSPDGPPPAIKH